MVIESRRPVGVFDARTDGKVVRLGGTRRSRGGREHGNRSVFGDGSVGAGG
ncbi:MAG: hypothetical protein AVDCRST_MAG19-1948 [uncultured Thermomicrobiales bacterium]|uniref:Uncharacterized protein n=1 Tax=uncultured Thermomicrobiales bacterium TaxID=1645740 RepID=A0A6J4UZN8_9BACT|nr:MAG: hypothetical protein AVDCRST_MAG19-1948 [uncultured Thermomicrobiales bacterium]